MSPAPYAGTPPSTDSTKPTAPGTPVVSNTNANQTATVTVTASSDNVAVVGYAAFLDGSQAEWNRSATNVIPLSGVPAGEHSVVVMAFDAAGNYSNPSAATVFTIPQRLEEAPAFVKFAGSIYSGLKSATTAVAGQSEALASGATKIMATNKDANNSLIIGFGMSAAEAEVACSGGVAGQNKFTCLADSLFLQPVGQFTHYAWLGVGGTVSARIVQGV